MVKQNEGEKHPPKSFNKNTIINGTQMTWIGRIKWIYWYNPLLPD